MANEEHKQLAQYIKEIHASLRKSAAQIGVKEAWEAHCKNKSILTTYAECMEKLATVYWENNCADTHDGVVSRIEWSANFCSDYYINKNYLKFREKDIEVSKKCNVPIEVMENFCMPLKLLDVGSCYNPFNKYEYFNVTAIDLCPANVSVYQCDFLNVSLGSHIIIENKAIKQLQQKQYDIITFCFFLEYIPNSDLRIRACENAYKLLKFGGLLIINTPDSKHVGANSKLIKCWRFTLATIGFTRIKYEKFKHMHCMAFRKSLHKDIATRWAKIHKEGMESNLNIPQDFLNEDNDKVNKENNSVETQMGFDWYQLPFSDIAHN